MKIQAKNRTAQLLHRATGNPGNTVVTSAISNCFPGLEFDFKNFWRRALVGIELHEADNLVVAATDARYEDLIGRRLLAVDEQPVVVQAMGPYLEGASDRVLGTAGNPEAVVAMEWANVLAYAMQKQGATVICVFTKERSPDPAMLPTDTSQMTIARLTVRHMFVGNTAAVAEGVVEPGELTQGLCSPWQHDYRECSCYYWPATRPDFVNPEVAVDGTTRGDNWLSKERTGSYVLDDRRDGRLVNYDELFISWERMLHFVVKARDADESGANQ